ncbi:acetolactate synthase large subunit [Aeromicrobium sp.]|uniref:acetolactate synthase large subunit n=1 Tax=Aeromicrobium sp. TaxID=1871063 RepID=UPI002FC739AC
MNGAQSLIAALEAVGVEVVFGVPGGAILPAYDALHDSSVRHVLVRHEQGAGHAAEGYALATGHVGVCMATSGPGATNLVTPLADAYMDSIPIVAITGQVESPKMGTDAFQEADIRGITMPITKHSYLVEDADDIPRVIAEAFHVASTGRPGPVLVDISKSALTGQATFSWPPTLRLPGYSVPGRPSPSSVARAAGLISEATRPILYVGGGVIRARASDGLRQLADMTGIPVVTTLTARGAFPDSHPLHLGMPGMHGTVAAVAGLQRSDLIIALGARFDDRVTGEPRSFAPGARVVHADIDAAEIGKNRAVDVPIVGDCNDVIEDLVRELATRSTPDLDPWRAFLKSVACRYPLGYSDPDEEGLAPQYVLERLGVLAGPGAIFVAGVGQHQMWAQQFIPYEQPSTWLSSAGLGTMGFSVPAAMGAKLGRPDATVWSVDGDGCFQMTNQELATCALEGMPIKVAVINNESLGMVRQQQSLYFGGRVNNISLQRAGSQHFPDFAKLAEALGCVGLMCDAAREVDNVIDEAMKIHDRPVVIDFRVSREAMVWPSIAAGASNDDLQYAENLAPVFDEDDLGMEFAL